MFSQRNLCRRRWQRNHNSTDRTAFKIIENNIRKKIFDLKNENFSKMLSGLNFQSRKFWKVTKLIKNRHNKVPPLKDSAGNTYFTDLEKAEIIASKFKSNHHTGQNLSDTLTNGTVERTVATLDSQTIDPVSVYKFLTKPKEIATIIKYLKKRKSPGEDSICNILLKHLPKKALVMLTLILNACLQSGYFPDTWKCSKVIAIPKPGKDVTNPNNFRPISLLNTLSKILERIVLNRIKTILYDQKILLNEQFGFREGHSTSHQLLRVVKHIQHNFKNKKSTGIILLDVEKAFDSVWHKGQNNTILSCAQILLCQNR